MIAENWKSKNKSFVLNLIEIFKYVQSPGKRPYEMQRTRGQESEIRKENH